MLENILIILLIAVIIVVGVIVCDSNRFVVREYSVSSDKISKDYTFIVLSDLHCKSYGDNNKKLLDAIENIRADACLIPGDMITAVPGKETVIPVKLLTKIHELMPVYYSFGNHEYRAKIYTEVYDRMFSEYEEALSDNGISISDNIKEAFGEIDIYSLSIGKEYYRRFKSVKMKGDYIESKLGECDKDRFSILLAHNPEYFEAYTQYGANLILSGHVHGGLVRLPFIGGMVSPKVRFFPKYDGGRFDKEETSMIVSRGLGNHSIPIRFNNPGEIVVIHVKRS